MPGQNAPAAPIDKLYTRLQQAQEFGKEFDEVRERKVMGLEPVEGRAAIFVAERADRAKMTEREDVAGARDMAMEAKLASAGEQARSNAVLQAQNETLMAQIAELKGEKRETLPTPKPTTPLKEPNIRTAAVTAAKNPVTLPGGEPNADWTRNQMYEFLKEHARPLPPNPVSLTKTAALDYVTGEVKKMKAEASA